MIWPVFCFCLSLLCRVKEVPVEVYEMDGTVSAFAWEPAGHRFAVVHDKGDGQSGAGASISFLSLKKKKIEARKGTCR